VLSKKIPLVFVFAECQGRKVSKKEVSKYLQEQKKEKERPLNTALADALKGLKDEKNRS